MAVASWAAAEPRAVAWVCLDRYDNRPSAFWSYVVAALRRSGIVIPRALSAAAQRQATEHAFLLRLAAALTDQDLPVVLVLDDFHVLTEPKVLNGLDFVLRNAAADLRLVISSRMDPLLRLHRYRLAGELTEIRARDLAFDTAEAGLLMARHNCRLSADSLECLTQRTEGWAAGLRLAAISLDSHPDPDQFVKELITEDSALTSYLVEEVLNAQPPEARDVLLSTSILEQVTAEAASELTGSEQAAGILHALARGNMLIDPPGPGAPVHPLFAEVLRLKLSLTLRPGMTPAEIVTALRLVVADATAAAAAEWMSSHQNSGGTICAASAAGIPSRNCCYVVVCMRQDSVSGCTHRIFPAGPTSSFRVTALPFWSTAASGMDMIARYSRCRQRVRNSGPVKSAATMSVTSEPPRRYSLAAGVFSPSGNAASKGRAGGRYPQ